METLEPRWLPSFFTFVFDDPGNRFAAYPLLRGNLEAAGQILSRYFESLGTIEVLVRVDNNQPTASASAATNTFVRQEGGFQVVEEATLTEARTGFDANGAAPDINFAINTTSYLPVVWFDPTGAARTAVVPADKTDFTSIALHELMHGMGFNGFRVRGGVNNGLFTQGVKSTYDALTAFGAGGDPSVLYFIGPLAQAVYGGPVPLTSYPANDSRTSANFTHLGNEAGRPGFDLRTTVMHGIATLNGFRYLVEPVEVAVLADLGLKRTAFPPAPQGNAPAPLVGNVTGLVPVSVVSTRRLGRDRFRQRLIVVNTSNAPLADSLMLVVSGLRRGTRLLTRTGVTHRASVPNSPFLVVPLPGGLQPGRSLIVELTFRSPTRPRYRTEVFTGISLQ